MNKVFTPAGIVADICLYGSSLGSGWILVLADGRTMGTGEPKAGITLTQSLWTAIGALEVCFDLHAGRIRVFEPSGRRVAESTIERPHTVGDLPWTPAPVYTISAEAIIAAATEQKERN